MEVIWKDIKIPCMKSHINIMARVTENQNNYRGQDYCPWGLITNCATSLLFATSVKRFSFFPSSYDRL